MNYFEQQPFALPEFAANPDPRCPCVLLLDVSGSMQGKPIQELARGFETFCDALRLDEIAARRAEIAIVSFGPVQVAHEFALVDNLQEVDLKAGGDTPIGAAIEKGLELLEARKTEYKANGIQYYRPWMFLITDGAPTDNWTNAAARIHQSEAEKRLSFFAVGVQGADMSVLKQLGVREPVGLTGLDFKQFFVWLSASLSAVSNSKIGESVNLPSPQGWASV